MPFIQSAETTSAKLHVSEVRSPVLIGVLVLAGIAALLFAFNIATAAQGLHFQLEENSTAAELLAGEGQGSTEQEETVKAAGNSTDVPILENGGANAVQEIYVFVSGEVASPGVYVFSEGARVVEAIEAAGGFSENAATNYNNLAAVMQDGQHIYVPSTGELEQGTGGVATAENFREIGGEPASGLGTGLININTASQSELEQLPGVGPATAQKIIANREEQGPFASIEDLTRVSGIGEKKFEALKDLVCV